MKVMVMVKATKNCEAGVKPSHEVLTEMGKFNDELVKQGIFLAVGGLLPSSTGKRVKFAGKDRTVIDGPFTETKELVSGYWFWNVKSMEEAIEWVKRCPMPEEAEIEIRQEASAEDLGDAFNPELRRQKQIMRDEVEKQTKS